MNKQEAKSFLARRGYELQDEDPPSEIEGGGLVQILRAVPSDGGKGPVFADGYLLGVPDEATLEKVALLQLCLGVKEATKERTK